jgi:hypothetical protein
VGGFGLGLRGAGEGVEVRRGLALGEGLGDDDVDGAAVFRVDEAESVERCMTRNMSSSLTMRTLG